VAEGAFFSGITMTFIKALFVFFVVSMRGVSRLPFCSELLVWLLPKVNRNVEHPLISELC